MIKGDVDNEICIKDDNINAESVLKGVYCSVFHYLSRYGMYVFRFYKNCNWKYVIIDDRLPSNYMNLNNKKLVFSNCKNPQEFWAPLIEKAYAKLHNCYQALNSGYVDNAL